MSSKGAYERICSEVEHWEFVHVLPHRFGGSEFRVGRREIGHIHGNSLLDIPFPMNVRDELVRSGIARPHHILPESGWVSLHIHSEQDVDRAISLLRQSYDLARKSGK